MKIANRLLRIGENVQHRVCRPAWTSETSTGMFNSCKHRHSRNFGKNFYRWTEGFYKKQTENVAHCTNKGGRV